MNIQLLPKTYCGVSITGEDATHLRKVLECWKNLNYEYFNGWRKLDL